MQGVDPEAEGERGLEHPFVEAIAPLADGNLTYSSPFDLSASAALADNVDSGSVAEKLFDVTALRRCGYQVTIAEIAPGHPELPRREVLNTQVESLHALTVILEDLLDELHAHHGKDPYDGQADH